MIALISSSARERLAFASLCEIHQWACAECDSLREFRKLLRHTSVEAVLVRHRLTDGYSDDVFNALAENESSTRARVLVLLASGTAPAIEARQVKLGADCVLRDPVRVEVLLEYLAKYQQAETGPAPAAKSHPPAEKVLRFAGGEVLLVEREWRLDQRATRITPREIDLVEVLVHTEGRAVSYHNLFSEILGRRFRGDTANLRVLLGLLDASGKRIGIKVRDWIEVIPKLGYRYRCPEEQKTNQSNRDSRGDAETRRKAADS